MALIGREWSRREFLRAAGIGASASALLPFIPTAAAQTAQAGIKRLVLFTHPNGTMLHRWRSNGTGAAFVNGQLLPQLQGPILAPLDRHRAAVNLVDGLDLESGAIPRIDSATRHQPGHHGIATLWSGGRLVRAPLMTVGESFYSSTATIDQLLAASATTRVRSLTVSTSKTGKGTYNPTEGITAYAGPSLPIAPEDDPRVVFDLLFAGGVDGTAAATQRRRVARRSILTNIKGELTRLRAELPQIDRERLEHHLDGIDDLDRRIAASASAPVCVPGAMPGVTAPTDVLPRIRLHVDIVKHAFACDLTRVASILVGSEAGTPYWLPVSELPANPNTGDMHGASHETYSAATEAWRRTCVEIMSRLQRSMAEEFAKMLDALDEGPGPTLLQDTLAVWGTAMGWGGIHVNHSVPFVLASKSPRMRAGRYHRFSNYELDIETSMPAHPYVEPTLIVPHNRLLTTVMHLMGRTDVQALGDAGANGKLGGRDLDNSPITGLIS